MKNKIIVFLVIIMVTVSITSIKVNAKPNNTQADIEAVGYGVEAIIPSNQIDKKQSYFDLKMSPGQKQDIEVIIRNGTKKDITIETEVTYASTGRNGNIIYSLTNLKDKDESLKYPLSQIVKVNDNQKEIILKGNSEKKVKFHIEMPKDEYDGIILGGLKFKRKLESKDDTSKEGVMITNQYEYVIGVKLSETDKYIKPNINLKDIKPTLINYHTAVGVNLQNDTPTIINNLTIDAKVYKKGSNKVFRQEKKDKQRMAPNSNFNFSIDWQNQKIENGNYTLKMIVSNNAEKWEWNRDFTIGNVDNINKNAVEIKDNNIWVYIAISGLAILALLAIYNMKKE